jgi:transcriptional regulator with XRE-family HTH domain
MSEEKFLKGLLRNIEKRRKEKQLTYEELASRCDMEKQSMHRLLNGNGNITASYLYRIANALDIPVHELLKF